MERRPSPADQPVSYGIHLNASGLGALRACLPAANWEQLIRSSVPALDMVRFHDPQLKTLASIMRPPAPTRRCTGGRSAAARCGTRCCAG